MGRDDHMRFLTKRNFLKVAVVAGFVSVLPLPLMALTANEAAHLVRQFISDINITTDANRSDPEVFQGVEALFYKYSNIRMIARSALGVDWRSASDAQKAKYVQVFGEYLGRKYGRQFQNLAIIKVTVSSVRKAKTGFMVNSIAHLRDNSQYMIEWQVIEIHGKNKLVNLHIEGISMLATERSEITNLLDAQKGDLDKFIEDLQRRG